MATEPTQEQMEQICGALASGRKIDAIKIYREASGQGLKEAKEFIDALVPRLKEQDPETYSNLSNQEAGCTSIIVLGAGFSFAVITSILRAKGIF